MHCRLRLHVCLLSVHRVKGFGVDDPRRYIRLGLALGPCSGIKDISEEQLRTVRNAMYTRFDTALNQAGYALSATATKWLVIDTPKHHRHPVKVMYLCVEIIRLSELMPSTP